ncbi:MAG: hypothetical protein GY796_28465 [Chloroflexi bacterium]|nr:hypothetical protein [Chloroflexota bacterium]
MRHHNIDHQRWGHGRQPLILALAVFLLLGVITIWRVPPFEGPDESQHFAYILWLADGNGFPPQDETAWETAIEQEASQPPLFYILASIPARLIDTANPTAEYRENPHFVGPFPRILPDNDNRAIHYPGDASPLAGGWLALYLARGIALAFGALLLISVYGLARQVTPDSYVIPLGTVFLTAVTPQLIYISSVASNDIPAAALSTLTLWLLAMYVRRGGGVWLSIGIGGVWGLAILAKVSAFVLIVPIGLGWLWVWHVNGRHHKQALINGLLLGGSTFAVAGWWFIRAWLLYGSPLGLQTHDATPWAINDPEELADFIPRWLEVFRSYWVSYGWGTIRPDGWVYDLLGLAAAVAVVGLLWTVYRWRPQKHTDEEMTTAVLMIILAAGLLTVMIFLEYWMHRVIAPYGRLVFPAITATSLFMIIGWRAIHPRLPAFMCVMVGLLALLGPFTTMRAAFSLPRPLTTDQVAQLPQSLGIFFGPTANQPVAELLSAQPVASSVEAGKNVAVEICWRALAQTERDLTILLHIVGPDNNLTTNRRTYPGLGRFPTSVWIPETAFCDIVRAPVWQNPPQTILYTVEVALYDEELNERLPAFSTNGDLLSQTFVNDIRLEIADPPDPLELLVEAGNIQLLDYTAADVWQPGTQETIELSWGVATPVNQDLQTFVHLRDPQSDEIIAQADGSPIDGWYPTSWWTEGELVVDERPFPLPPDISPGTYDLVVGFYDLASGQRVGEEYLLQTVEVEAVP